MSLLTTQLCPNTDIHCILNPLHALNSVAGSNNGPGRKYSLDSTCYCVPAHDESNTNHLSTHWTANTPSQSNLSSLPNAYMDNLTMVFRAFTIMKPVIIMVIMIHITGWF